jgi:hypothetical protein
LEPGSSSDSRPDEQRAAVPGQAGKPVSCGGEQPVVVGDQAD